MNDRLTDCTLALTIAAALLSGCVGTDKDLKFFPEADVKYHKNVAQTIDYPDVYTGTAHEAAATAPPRTIASRRKDTVEDLRRVRQPRGPAHARVADARASERRHGG